MNDRHDLEIAVLGPSWGQLVVQMSCTWLDPSLGRPGVSKSGH